ncbi:MAG TPA: hypothetical protein VKM72_34995 [Thermoanaerobaculia bacterium]|nr:hypothetical protein [Thermoanaerobaculia bacterium]
MAFGIDELGIDGQNPPRLYARLGSRVLATADRGANWLDVGPPADLSDPLYFSDPSLAVAPDDSQTLYVSESRNLAQSTDGGRSWTIVQNPCVILSGLLLEPRDSGHLFAEGHFLSGFCGRIPKALLHSRDGGQTWDQLIAVEWRYLAIDSLDSSVYVEDSAGDLWRIVPGPSSRHELLFPELSATALAVSPLVPGTLWAVRPGAVGRSRDGGRTWSFSSAGLPEGAVVFKLAPDPADPATLYAGISAQGVFKSTDAGETWTPVGTWPAGVHLQGGLLVDPADPSILYAGTDTAGVLMFDQED